MQAFVKYGRGRGEAGLRDYPVPTPGPGEVLVRVEACGVCGSDLHAIHSDPGYEFVEPPVVLGHELAGTVAELGPGVGSWQIGDTVVAVAIQGCGRCETCLVGLSHLCPQRAALGLHRDGGMAGYVRVRAEHLVPVPGGVALRDAALAEPLSVAVHAVLDRGRVQPGDRVVVTGPGPIGLLCALVARAAGGEVLLLGTGADAAFRLPAAERLGLAVGNLDQAPVAWHLQHHFGPRSPDAWIEAAGAGAALAAAISGVRPGGTVTVVGLYAQPFSFFPTPAVRAEVDLRFSYASSYPNYQVALDLLRRRVVDPAVIVSPYPLSRAPAAVAAAVNREVVKPLLLPWEVQG